MVSMGHFHIAPTKFPFALVSRDSDNHIFQDKKLSSLHTLFQLLLHILLLFKINHVAAFIINLHISNYIYYMKINERIKKVYRGFSRYADSLKFLQIEVSSFSTSLGIDQM